MKSPAGDRPPKWLYRCLKWQRKTGYRRGDGRKNYKAKASGIHTIMPRSALRNRAAIPALNVAPATPTITRANV
jgi:hypothetical protein